MRPLVNRVLLRRETLGRRPAVIIDEEGLVLKLLLDLAMVDGQTETLASLAESGLSGQ